MAWERALRAARFSMIGADDGNVEPRDSDAVEQWLVNAIEVHRPR